MKIAIQDANIIIDLIECEVFDAFFDLPLEVHTTSLVIAEIIEFEQERHCKKVIRSRKLKVLEISTEDYLRLQARRLAGLSETDLSVLEMAQKKQALLLTGDGSLRKQAKHKKVDTRGIIWIFDELVAHGICEKPFAALKLELLRDTNPRLPRDELDRRIKAWKR